MALLHINYISLHAVERDEEMGYILNKRGLCVKRKLNWQSPLPLEFYMFHTFSELFIYPQLPFPIKWYDKFMYFSTLCV